MEPGDIRRLMEERGLVLREAPTEANPFMPGDNSDMVHHYCTLSGGGIEAFEFYASTTPDIEPDAADLVAVLLEDVKAYRGCAGYADFMLVFGLSDDEGRADVELAWDELSRLAPLAEQVVAMANETASNPSVPGMKG